MSENWNKTLRVLGAAVAAFPMPGLLLRITLWLIGVPVHGDGYAAIALFAAFAGTIASLVVGVVVAEAEKRL